METLLQFHKILIITLLLQVKQHVCLLLCTVHMITTHHLHCPCSRISILHFQHSPKCPIKYMSLHLIPTNTLIPPVSVVLVLTTRCVIRFFICPTWWRCTWTKITLIFTSYAYVYVTLNTCKTFFLNIIKYVILIWSQLDAKYYSTKC